MTGFGGVDEERRGTCARHRGCNFTGDVAGFPDSADHHSAATLQNESDCRDEAFVYAAGKSANGICFDFEHTPAKFKDFSARFQESLLGCAYHSLAV